MKRTTQEWQALQEELLQRREDPKVADQLVESIRRAVCKMAQKKFAKRNRLNHDQIQDLVRNALFAVWKSIESYDASRGAKFSSWALKRCYWSMCETVNAIKSPVDLPQDLSKAERYQDRTVRMSRRAVGEDVAWGRLLHGESDVIERIETMQKLKKLREGIAQLKPGFRQVMQMELEESLSMNEIAQILGVSRQRVDQLRHDSIRRLAAYVHEGTPIYSPVHVRRAKERQQNRKPRPQCAKKTERAAAAIASQVMADLYEQAADSAQVQRAVCG